MDQRDVIVTSNHVAQRAQSLVHTLDRYRWRQGIPQVLKFLVGRGGRHEESVSVPGGQTADDARAGDGGVNNGDDIGKLGFEDRVKVRGGAQGGEAVAFFLMSDEPDSQHGDYGARMQVRNYELVSFEKTPMSVEFSY